MKIQFEHFSRLNPVSKSGKFVYFLKRKCSLRNKHSSGNKRNETMMGVKFLITLFLFHCIQAQFSCSVSHEYKRKCHRYRFEGSCQPWNLTNCQPIRTVQRDYRCPVYRCVSFYFVLFNHSLFHPTLHSETKLSLIATSSKC